MGSVNKVILVGNLGADPELKYTPSSRPLCNLRIATTEVFKDKSGQRQEKTEWHRVTVWGDQAENCSKYLAKGRSVYVEGRLQTRSYDKEGQKHYATDIVADRVVFLGSGGGGGGRWRRRRRWRRRWRRRRGKVADLHGILVLPTMRTAARLRPTTTSRSEPPRGEPGATSGVRRQVRVRLGSSAAYRSAEIVDRIHAGGSSARCAIGPVGADSRSGLGRQP